MRESGDEKSTLRQIEKIKALSEDMLEYQAIDVHKAWQSMEREGYESDKNRMFVMNLATKELQFLENYQK